MLSVCTLTDGIIHGNRRKRAECAKRKKKQGGDISPVPHTLEPLRLFDRRNISTGSA